MPEKNDLATVLKVPSEQEGILAFKKKEQLSVMLIYLHSDRIKDLWVLILYFYKWIFQNWMKAINNTNGKSQRA